MRTTSLLTPLPSPSCRPCSLARSPPSRTPRTDLRLPHPPLRACSYIISVLAITDVGSGLIVPGTGQAQFKVEYNAIVYKPFKNEVVDGVVNNVSKMGIFLDVGPLSVFVSSHVSLRPFFPSLPSRSSGGPRRGDDMMSLIA